MSMSRSAAMPPEDPWLSGFGISYYYFGYLMTSVIARLAFVPEYIAFNLGIAWLVAGTAVGAFGLVYNMIALNGKRSCGCGFGAVSRRGITHRRQSANDNGSAARQQCRFPCLLGMARCA